MVNINGKEWPKLEASDIQSALSDHNFDESFYFEFKDDRVANKKLTEEISAFANTFGGYVFLGISDDKKIEGCIEWTEQRIHTLIHDSITPTPPFDVKKFTFGANVIFVIKIDEGAEPPYITSSGKIYERLSSGSFVIKDSIRLSQIYSKREQMLAKTETKISIPPIPENVNNIYGCIDIGFSLVVSDLQAALDEFNSANLKAIANGIEDPMRTFSLSRVGNSIVYTPGGVTTTNGHLPAHTNNFLEIMADGSARMRILLLNNDQNDTSVNMYVAISILQLYKEIYTQIMGKLFPNKMVYAKKYEALTVRKQFQPVILHDKNTLAMHPEYQIEHQKMLQELRNHRNIFGITTVITDDRIPKTGLYTVDKRQLEIWGEEFTFESILRELFLSRFTLLGAVFPPEDV